jgi:molybdopterin synthase catalytic subunit
MTARLTHEPIDAAGELAAFEAERRAHDGETGAIVSFSGLVRAEAGAVTALELEAYPGFAERLIDEMARSAATRHDLLGWRIVHRIGRMDPGATVVFVACAARHRRNAFEGCDQMMDWLKSRAPFWKKSHEPDGARWIDPRPEDYKDAARWD